MAIVVLPLPVAPTSAIFSPCLAEILIFFKTVFSLLYPKTIFFISIFPRTSTFSPFSFTNSYLSFSCSISTLPSSTSGSWSIRAKTLSTPAKPIMIEFNCIETWLIFPENCFVIFKNGTTILILIAIPERLKLYTLKYIKRPPTIATTT